MLGSTVRQHRPRHTLSTQQWQGRCAKARSSNSSGGGSVPPPRLRSTAEGGDDGQFPWRRSARVAFTFSAASSLAFPESAHASDDIDRYVDTFLTAAGPMLTNLGFSGLAGLCVGKAIKAVSGIVAFFLGLAFIATQIAASQGIITVNWTYMEERVTKMLDKNKDGKVDVSDAKHHLNKGLGILAQGVPSVGGFLAGLTLGLKW
eukprot:jgi/Ulvmu1/6951/UM033_0008.1